MTRVIRINQQKVAGKFWLTDDRLRRRGAKLEEYKVKTKKD